MSYKNYLESEGAPEDIHDFKQYLLGKDTIIIPEMWEMVCSEWVSKKIHEDVSQVQGRYFYRNGDIIYFIYSKYFPWVGQVKVFFDTTQYIKSQLIIIKVGVIFIFLVFLVQFFLGKIISRKLLSDLISISEKLKKYSIEESNVNMVECSKCVPEDDEIRILAESLNDSHKTVRKQTGQLRQFLTDVSHEFKTPLMALSSRLDLLEKKRDTDKLQKEDITKHIAGTKHYIKKMNNLLETLFLLTRAESDIEKGVEHTENIKVQSYIEAEAKRIFQSFPHKEIHLDIDVPENLEWNMNIELFLILFDNILHNAIKFAPEKTKILIEADDTKISISDNGEWIPKNQRKKIFEKFYRNDTNKEWFGVGLFLSQRIAKLLDWNIQVADSSLGGAKFTLYFKNK